MLQDDQLRLMFTCCHPALAIEAQVALTLRAIGGLTTPEIASAFLVPEATMAQRIVRAKRKIREAGIEVEMDARDGARKVLEQVKEHESQGYQYDNAEASFEMLVRRTLTGYQSPFELIDFWVVQRRAICQDDHGREMQTEAMVKVRVGEEVIQTAADGNGPVNALDAAVRKALVTFYPKLAVIKLVDYKVRIIDTAAGTGAAVRVLIESTDGDELWRTVGASTDIIEASWRARNDALEYWLLKHGTE